MVIGRIMVLLCRRRRQLIVRLEIANFSSYRISSPMLMFFGGMGVGWFQFSPCVYPYIYTHVGT